jgi:hypothetical protein
MLNKLTNNKQNILMKRILFLLAIVLNPGMLFSQDFGNEMFQLSKIRNDIKSKQVSSADITGGNGDCLTAIKDGAKAIIMDVKGAGVITHIWITIAPEAEKINRNDIIIRMYWDGNSFPSVESPIGPFFGNGWNEAYNFVSLPLSVSPGWGKSYVCYFAMPFSNGAKIEIENQTGREISNFYFNINYNEMPQIPKNT